MSRFLGLTIFLIIAIGVALHADVELPWFAQWIGELPGDMVIKKGGLVIYAPLTSSALISAVLSFILSLFSRNGN